MKRKRLIYYEEQAQTIIDAEKSHLETGDPGKLVLSFHSESEDLRTRQGGGEPFARERL